MLEEMASGWSAILTVMLVVHVAPAMFLVLRTKSFGELAFATVLCGIAYAVLMPIPDFGCADFEQCGGGVVVDTLMKPFVVICWACLLGSAAIKAALLMFSRSGTTSY